MSKKVLTTKGRVIELPFKNSQLNEDEKIIATDSEGGILITTSEKDFNWDTIENHYGKNMEGLSPVKFNTFQNQLDYHKALIADSLKKVEFLEKLV